MAVEGPQPATAPASARGRRPHSVDVGQRNAYSAYQETSAAMEYPSMNYLSKTPRAAAFSFGARLGKMPGEKVAVDVPGPGSYYEPDVGRLAKYSKVPQFSFGSATRHEEKKPRVPGPGAYMHMPCLGKDGVKISCTPRRTEPRPRGKVPPGPGAHDLPTYVGKSAPSCSITPRRPVSRAYQPVPGPGDYDSTDAIIAGAKPKWGFGTSPQRPKELIDQVDPTPGPGAYRQETAKTGPKFSMRGRTACVKERLAKF